MDGVMHPSVEQAIGRDRIRKAFKRYENNPADEHVRGIVRAVNSDGSYEVLIDGDVQTARCAPYAKAMVGDRVIVVTTKDGENVLLGRLGGEIETIAPTIEERFEGIESEIDLLKTNKVLWSGGYYMAEGHTATLAEAISAQPNGVILAWSSYTSGTANNYGWVFTFVPKYHASAHDGSGIVCSGFNSTGNVFFNKYVYVYDTKITGHAQNDDPATSMNSNIQRTNNENVLRYVIGV